MPAPTGLAIAAFVLATVGLARLLHRRHVGGMLLIVVGVVLIDLQVHA
jgi:hypothetical protein